MLNTKDRKTQILLNMLFTISCVIILLPLWILISVSFSNELDVAKYGYMIIPKRIDLAAYRYIFKNPITILNAYKITAIYSIISMIAGTLLMAMIAYPLTKKDLNGRRIISFYLYFTMLFGGGLVPEYILNTQYLHLGDSIWIYIIPSLISPWSVFMIRTFFQGLPGEISESALVDGANEYTIFFRIILPISKPVLATVMLMIFLGKWNDWYTAMLYINNDKLMSLQYMLQRIMQNIKLLQDSSFSGAELLSDQEIPSETVRMAMAMVVAGPALVVFPFFQKYFVKGLTVGSVKG